MTIIHGHRPGTETPARSRVPALRAPHEADPNWRDYAACSYEDPELFFPIGGTGIALLQIEDAKAVCWRCPVVTQCLDWALTVGEDAGVWGGMSEEERRSLKRRTAKQRQREAKAKAEA